jgi:glycosyltransferase involved in cell wall biosynthesis
MKILAYVHAYVGMGRNAGAETTLHDVLRYLAGRGHEVRALVSQANFRDPMVIDGVTVLPQRSKRCVLHEVPRCDLVITHLDNAPRTTLVAKKYRIPCVHYVHNTMGPTHGYIAMKPDLVLFNAHWTRAEFPEIEVPHLVVYPPVDGAAYTPAPGQRGTMVTMVNAFPSKGADTFWRIVDLMPTTKFLLVKGGYGHQDIRPRPNVEVWDNTPDMRGVYAASRCVIMPSQYESFGRVAVEAASAGIPSVVCPTTGLREALGDAGIYAETPEEFSAHLRRLSHWKAAEAAGKRLRARYEELSAETARQLAGAADVMENIASTARLLRR